MQLVPKTVAVVEDDQSMRRSVQRLLDAHGFVTSGFPSAEAYLSDKAAATFSCLVLDVDLGGMSGTELQQVLTESGSTIPVIFITALEDDSIEEEAVRGGCIAYLHKPFPGSVLVKAINDALA
ncbi:response regulator [Pararhizobium sp. A13]|uniref:response regulator transcription factor n=1 Tax=Pararhizobium sp. A13 TaxID=3133975 RepID=UPI00311AC209